MEEELESQILVAYATKYGATEEIALFHGAVDLKKLNPIHK